MTDKAWYAVTSRDTGTQHNSSAAPLPCTMATTTTTTTNPQGTLLQKVLSIVDREKLVSGIDEIKKVVEFVHPEELKVITT